MFVSLLLAAHNSVVVVAAFGLTADDGVADVIACLLACFQQ
jgi:hypothetical protein